MGELDWWIYSGSIALPSGDYAQSHRRTVKFIVATLAYPRNLIARLQYWTYEVIGRHHCEGL